MKTAGSSVEAALHETLDSSSFCSGGYNRMTGDWEYSSINNLMEYRNMDGEMEYHDRLHQHTPPDYFFKKIKFPEIYDSYRKITIVRNPWEVILSYYWYSTTVNPEHFAQGDRTCIIYEGDSKQMARRKFKFWLAGTSRYESHTSFHDNPNGLEMTSIDFMKQEINAFHNDDIITDYMRHEKLEQHFRALCEYIGHPNLKLPRLKSDAKKSKKEHYSYFYDKQSEKLVALALKEYIEKFGYTFDRRVK